MPEPLRQLIDLAQARPAASVAVAIAVILYARLMLSGPHRP